MKTDKPDVDESHLCAGKVEAMLDELIHYLRTSANDFDDRGGRVLFEASAEMLLGLKTAFNHFRRRSEPAMR